VFGKVVVAGQEIVIGKVEILTTRLSLRSNHGSDDQLEVCEDITSSISSSSSSSDRRECSIVR
jgi:hypothetical protein